MRVRRVPGLGRPPPGRDPARARGRCERHGDPEAGEWRALAIGLSAGLTATLVANVFYLTMQFYYFYGLVLIVAAASALAVAQVRRVAA